MGRRSALSILALGVCVAFASPSSASNAADDVNAFLDGLSAGDRQECLDFAADISVGPSDAESDIQTKFVGLVLMCSNTKRQGRFETYKADREGFFRGKSREKLASDNLVTDIGPVEIPRDIAGRLNPGLRCGLDMDGQTDPSPYDFVAVDTRQSDFRATGQFAGTFSGSPPWTLEQSWSFADIDMQIERTLRFDADLFAVDTRSGDRAAVTLVPTSESERRAGELLRTDVIGESVEAEGLLTYEWGEKIYEARVPLRSEFVGCASRKGSTHPTRVLAISQPGLSPALVKDASFKAIHPRTIFLEVESHTGRVVTWVDSRPSLDRETFASAR